MFGWQWRLEKLLVRGVGVVLGTLRNAKTSRVDPFLRIPFPFIGWWDCLPPSLAQEWAVTMVPRVPLSADTYQPQSLPCCCLPAITVPYNSIKGASKWQLLFLSLLSFSQSRQQQQGPHDSMFFFWAMGLRPLPLSLPSSFDATLCYFLHYYPFMPPETGYWKSIYCTDSSFPKAHLPSWQPSRYSFTQYNLGQSATSTLDPTGKNYKKMQKTDLNN